MFLFLVFLGACTPAGERPGHVHVKESQRILGGDEVQVQSGIERSLVMITLDDESGQSFVCTGTFISERLVLTASHCASADKERMRLLYGAAPFGGSFVDVPIRRTHLYPKTAETQRLDEAELRHDVALVEIAGTRPEGSAVTPVPSAEELHALDPHVFKDGTTTTPKFNARSSTRVLSFLAMGYGRVHGVEVTDANDVAGAGVLRRVRLESADYRPEAAVFTVAQLTGERGVCFGDSGGPAVVELLKPEGMRNVLVGIASGVFSATGTDEYAHGFDACKQHSLYMNIRPYLPWIARVQQNADLLRQAE